MCLLDSVINTECVYWSSVYWMCALSMCTEHMYVYWTCALSMCTEHTYVYWTCALSMCTEHMYVYWTCALSMCTTEYVNWATYVCTDSAYWVCVLSMCTEHTYVCILNMCTEHVYYWVCELSYVLMVHTECVYWACVLSMYVRILIALYWIRVLSMHTDRACVLSVCVLSIMYTECVFWACTEFCANFAPHYYPAPYVKVVQRSCKTLYGKSVHTEHVYCEHAVKIAFGILWLAFAIGAQVKTKHILPTQWYCINFLPKACVGLVVHRYLSSDPPYRVLRDLCTTFNMGGGVIGGAKITQNPVQWNLPIWTLHTISIKDTTSDPKLYFGILIFHLYSKETSIQDILYVSIIGSTIFIVSRNLWCTTL